MILFKDDKANTDKSNFLSHWERQNVIIPIDTILRMMGETGEDFHLALTLYVFLYVTARRLKSVQQWAPDEFCKAGLEWSDEDYNKAKETLIKHGFIEITQSRELGDPCGRKKHG